MASENNTYDPHQIQLLTKPSLKNTSQPQSGSDKKYILAMFRIQVGSFIWDMLVITHWLVHSKHELNGYQTFMPMGWDAFEASAESCNQTPKAPQRLDTSKYRPDA